MLLRYFQRRLGQLCGFGAFPAHDPDDTVILVRTADGDHEAKTVESGTTRSGQRAIIIDVR